MPPRSIEAEERLLAICASVPGAIDDAIELVRPEDMAIDPHQVLLRTLIRMVESGKTIEIGVVYEELKRTGEIDAVGGYSRLCEILETGHGATAVKEYATTIRDCSRVRQLIAATSEILQGCYQTIFEADDLICDAEQSIFAINERDAGNNIWDMESLARESHVRLAERTDGQASGILTGFPEIDSRLGGMRTGQLIVLAARPGMGKTALAMAVAVNVAELDTAALFVSLEMGRCELTDRLICTLGEVDSQRFQAARFLNADEKARITTATERIIKLPVIIDDNAIRNVSQISAVGRKSKRKRNIGLIVIDYLQLIDTPRSKDSRQEKVAAVSKGLKGLARQLGIPVIVLAQLNRECEKRPDKKPHISDLRESGAIEQDADVVMLLFRAGYYDSANDDGTAEVIIAKNRNGPTGTARLHFEGRFTKFSNLSRQQEPDRSRHDQDQEARSYREPNGVAY